MWPLGVLLSLLSGWLLAICYRDYSRSKRMATTEPLRPNLRPLAAALLPTSLATVGFAVLAAHDLYITLGFASGYDILSLVFAPAAAGLWAITQALRIVARPASARSGKQQVELIVVTTIGFCTSICYGGLVLAVPLAILSVPAALPTALLAAPLIAMHRSLRTRAGEVLAAARTSPEPGVHPHRAVAAARGSLALLVLALLPFVATSCGLVDPKVAAIALVPIGLGVAVFAPLLMMVSSDATPAGMRTSPNAFWLCLLLWLAFAVSLYHEYSSA